MANYKKTTVDLMTAVLVAKGLLKHMADEDMIEVGIIVGSSRRGSAQVNDLEVLVAPKWGPAPSGFQGSMFDVNGPQGPDPAMVIHLKETLSRGPGSFVNANIPSNPSGDHVNLLEYKMEDFLAASPFDRADADGPKLKKFWYQITGDEALKVELYICTDPRGWGNLMAIRTGPQEFSTAMMGHALSKGWHHTGGLLHTHPKGGSGQTCSLGANCPQIMASTSEAQFFNHLGIDWVDPSDRSLRSLQLAIKDFQDHADEY